MVYKNFTNIGKKILKILKNNLITDIIGGDTDSIFIKIPKIKNILIYKRIKNVKINE